MQPNSSKAVKPRPAANPFTLLRNERGGLLGCLFRLLLLAALVVVIYRFGMPYFQAWRFKEAMSSQAYAADVNPDAEIRQVLAETATNLDIPVSEADLRIKRARDSVSISAEWQKEVTLPKFSQMLHFHREVRAPLTPQSQ
jgi:hypothetical protein